ncbi:hypothetical protein DACRYDRAFT_19113 [Dacryopinax primogenitus]|uniref:Uncharacterized protein n=1 Tax=Dacryopinax primogenitus (strain DJM 731) TaxID=1858805 RepID=M5FQ91_DACPD|nr:uncharacterized protein DACRYDRAFT_19113 [Dacryopinax primogenitus]EJT96819.1 hypothetical protein DACRYDRAFT_19113 [Dacryopinax primogenitus]
MSQLQPYNLSLSSSSPAFIYSPFRDGYWGTNGDLAGGWRSSFKGAPLSWPAANINNLIDGVAYEETWKDGASVTFTFEGTGFYFCLTSYAPNTYSVSMNGTAAGYLIQTGPCGSNGNVMAFMDNLPYGSHTVQLVAHPTSTELDQGSVQFYGANVTLGMNGTYTQNIVIDDRDPAWFYYGNWTATTANPYATSGSLHRNCWYNPSSLARYTFSDANVVWLLGQPWIDAGPYTVSLTGGGKNTTVTYNASNFWTSPQVILFAAADLDPGQKYTITLTNFDSSQPGSTIPVVANEGNQTCTSVDALVLTQTQPLPSPPGGSSGNSTGPIVGGVIGGVGGLLLLALLWWWWRRHQARNRNPRGQVDLNDPLEDALQASRQEPSPFFLGMLSAFMTSILFSPKACRQESLHHEGAANASSGRAALPTPGLLHPLQLRQTTFPPTLFKTQ